jgi:hypothetical protein
VPARRAVVTALVGPKVLPTKVMNPPVDGVIFANSESVLHAFVEAMLLADLADRWAL